MAKRLYVGGLPYSTTEDALRDAFSQAGTVTSASIVTDKMTGKSRGFGFVEMETDEDAEKAIQMFDGKEFDGRKIVVNEARPLAPRAPRSGGFGGGNKYGNNRFGGRGGGGRGNKSYDDNQYGQEGGGGNNW